MKRLYYDKCSDMIFGVLNIIETTDDISVVCDKEVAIELLELVADLGVCKEYDVDEIDKDVDEFIVSRIGDMFIVETMRFDNGKIKICEADYMVLTEDVLDGMNDFFIEDYFIGYIDSMFVDFDEYDLDDDIMECCDGDCSFCDCGCDLEDVDYDYEYETTQYNGEIVSDIQKEINKSLEKLSECDCVECVLNRYVEKIQKVGMCPMCLKAVLTDFADEVIGNSNF